MTRVKVFSFFSRGVRCYPRPVVRAITLRAYALAPVKLFHNLTSYFVAVAQTGRCAVRSIKGVPILTTPPAVQRTSGGGEKGVCPLRLFFIRAFSLLRTALRGYVIL